mmetsp:Transcript_32430/g.47643  ORF Transcript_32430/g.47643 Transcript_32430/m.47643 type:complete len:550 (-) Transcript_32430:245-1894(-)
MDAFSVIEELITATDTILSINDTDSTTNGSIATPTTHHPPLHQCDQREDNNTSMEGDVPTLFLLEECFSTLYGSRKEETKCANEEQQQHQTMWQNGSIEEKEVLQKKSWCGGIYDEKNHNDAYATMHEDSNSYYNRGRNRGDDGRRGSKSYISRNENYNTDGEDPNDDEDRRGKVHTTKHRFESFEKKEEEEGRDLLLEAVKARMKRQKEKARKECALIMNESHNKYGQKQIYDVSKKKVCTKGHQREGVDVDVKDEVNDNVSSVTELSSTSNNSNDTDEEVTKANVIASNCLQEFLLDVKNFQKQHSGGVADKEKMENFANTVAERYLCKRLDSQHVILTPMVCKVRKVIYSFVEKCCGKGKINEKVHFSSEKQLSKDVDEEKSSNQKEEILTPSSSSQSSSTTNKISSPKRMDVKTTTWKCNICWRDNDNADKDATCVTCGRARGYKVKNKLTLSPPPPPNKEQCTRTTIIGDMIIKEEQLTEKEEQNLVKCNYEREKEAKDKEETTKQSKENFFLKQKLDYEMDSRIGLADDINDVLASIRSSIDD